MDERINARLAVEALRNGVPSREAVEKLGCNQPKVEEQFIEMLARANDPTSTAGNSHGMLVSGDFGTGKSHLLTHLEHLALSRGFVCSKVSISKETPLYDMSKVFTSAMENGRIPGRQGRFIEEIAHALQPDTAEYTSFVHWADEAAENGQLSTIFPASLRIHEESHDLELMSEIEEFWSGDRILIKKIRDGLKLINKAQYFKVQAPKPAELPPQRLRFATELIKTVGYRGWVVLLDEVELIGSYSILQRGRSYAEIARWMGTIAEEVFPGLIFVGAVTDDFATEIISPDGRKKDWDYIPAKINLNPRYSHLVPRIKTGMKLLEQSNISLEPPSNEDIRATVETLRDLYRMAFDWDPPAQEMDVGGAGEWGRMRYKVRAAINEWDLRRLIPNYRPDITVDEFTTDYIENLDMEHTAKDDSD